jgi:hypothetical protein
MCNQWRGKVLSSENAEFASKREVALYRQAECDRLCFGSKGRLSVRQCRHQLVGGVVKYERMMPSCIAMCQGVSTRSHTSSYRAHNT